MLSMIRKSLSLPNQPSFTLRSDDSYKHLLKKTEANYDTIIRQNLMPGPEMDNDISASGDLASDNPPDVANDVPSEVDATQQMALYKTNDSGSEEGSADDDDTVDDTSGATSCGNSNDRCGLTLPLTLRIVVSNAQATEFRRNPSKKAEFLKKLVAGVSYSERDADHVRRKRRRGKSTVKKRRNTRSNVLEFVHEITCLDYSDYDDVTNDASEAEHVQNKKGGVKKRSSKETSGEQPNQPSRGIPNQKTYVIPNRSTFDMTNQTTKDIPNQMAPVVPNRETSGVTNERTTGTPNQRTDVVPNRGISDIPNQRTSAIMNHVSYIVPNHKTSVITNQATSVVPNQRTSDITNQRTSNIPNQKASVLPNRGTSDIPNQKSSDIPNQKSSDIPNQRTSNIPNQRSSDISNQRTSGILRHSKVLKLDKKLPDNFPTETRRLEESKESVSSLKNSTVNKNTATHKTSFVKTNAKSKKLDFQTILKDGDAPIQVFKTAERKKTKLLDIHGKQKLMRRPAFR